jgi:hypothetical protein
MKLLRMAGTLTSVLLPSAMMLQGVLGAPTTSQASEAARSQKPVNPQDLPYEERKKIYEKNKYFHEPGDDDVMHHYDARSASLVSLPACPASSNGTLTIDTSSTCFLMSRENKSFRIWCEPTSALFERRTSKHG